MAPATTTASGHPKRKRQRRRRTNISSDESDSSSSSSSSSGDSSSDSDSDSPAAPAPASVKPAQASKATEQAESSDSSDEDADSDSSSSSSGSDLSFLSDTGDRGGRRRGRGRRRGAQAAADGAVNGLAAAGTATGDLQQSGQASEARRPYPERSPSPSMLARADPSSFVPLGRSLFPLLQARVDKQKEEGAKLLDGLVEGDEGNDADAEDDEEEGKKREDRFGDWWRVRLVSEFEGDLGSLAAEPGLTPSRLSLLLTSLTTLSSLHTSSAAPSSSIWKHDPSASLDPLASLPRPSADDDAFMGGADGEDWARTKVGGEGDVEVGEEGVVADEKRSAKAKSKKEKRKSLPATQVDEVKEQEVVASSPAKEGKKEKKSRKKGRKSGVSEAGDTMDVDA
ncbi:hypothetical protein NBRC10513v2_002535 [Rhodotorula toruloides]|uniref:Uncharacterized protein n=1 Tax=Rhodotorula toruloides TaxID=5286 RepID=A0A0K3CMG3_RHOTO